MDLDQLRAALEGAHTVFAMTVSLYKPGGMEEEFVQNFHANMAPRPGPNGHNPTLWGVCLAGDTGKFVGAMLDQPDKHAGKALACATRCHTMTEMAEIMARSSGKNVTYAQVPKEASAGFLPEASRPTLLNMLSYFEEFGHYGPGTEQLVDEAAQAARGEPAEFEDCLGREPLQL